MRPLVIVRCGKGSLHRNWLRPGKRWSLAVSSFYSEKPADYPEADYFHFYKGGKWDGIAAFVKAHPEVLSNFDTFWLPDDDIDATPDQIDRLFAEFHAFHLELAQPSLTRGSFYHFPITLACRGSRMRFTNFVEIMVPVLSRSVFQAMLPLFQISKSGFGFDLIWSRITSDPKTKCAILDAVSVRHTRPVGSVLAKEIAKAGSAAGDLEMQRLFAALGAGITPGRPLVHALQFKNGWQIRGPVLCGLVQFLLHAPWISKGHNLHSGFRVFTTMLYRHLVSRPTFSSIGWASLQRAAAELDTSR